MQNRLFISNLLIQKPLEVTSGGGEYTNEPPSGKPHFTFLYDFFIHTRQTTQNQPFGSDLWAVTHKI